MNEQDVPRDYGVLSIIPEFLPLGFQDLVQLYNSNPDEKICRMIMVASEVEIQEFGTVQKITGTSGKVELSSSVSFGRNLPFFALVPGGWLPPPFILPRAYLFDRNVIGTFQQIEKGNTREIYQNTAWWLRFFFDNHVVINPFLYAFESNKKHIPTFEEFKNSFNEAVEIVKTVLPAAEIVTYEDEQFVAAYELITDVLKYHDREVQLLLECIPLILFPCPRHDRAELVNRIFDIADRLGLSYKSLPLLALLSCIYEDTRISGFNAARRILKPKNSYTEEDAYNALSDFRGILIYLALRAASEHFGGLVQALCTFDVSQMLFGCGLNFRDVKFVGNELNLTLEINQDLFPALSADESTRLAERILKG